MDHLTLHDVEEIYIGPCIPFDIGWHQRIVTIKKKDGTCFQVTLVNKEKITADLES
jgi:hypothetical protein